MGSLVYEPKGSNGLPLYFSPTNTHSDLSKSKFIQIDTDIFMILVWFCPNIYNNHVNTTQSA